MTAAHGARSRALLERAHAMRAAAKGRAELRAEKAALLPLHDPLGITRVLGICFWGRSGSRLLTSFLDHHEQVLLLPMEQSQRLYEFVAVHRDLSLHERLMAYPSYVESYTPLFGGEFAVEPAHYYAAVDVLVEAYRDQDEAVLRSSRCFFQFLHVAYSMAIGQRPATRQPLIVYAQHRLNYHTARLVADFPQARFVHTVRDPISCFDSTFQFYLANAYDKGQVERAAYPEAAVRTLVEMAITDRPNRGMEERSCAVRFEDMHLNTESLMRALADWVGIPFSPVLLESSFNGTPWIVSRGGRSWSGAVPAQAQRRAPNLWWTDRLLVQALFSENFIAWHYPSHRLLGTRLSRRLIAAALWVLPTRTGLLNSAPVWRARLLPAIRRGDGAAAWRALKDLAAGHADFVRQVRTALESRWSDGPSLLRPLEVPGVVERGLER